ncbi:MAG: two-component response regulator [Chloroflexi bacterium]|nr:two-component response regulator [Chloroflexota bacterium]
MYTTDNAPPVVLIVEDNQANLLLARALLRRAGYGIEEAQSAEEAMERLGGTAPDLILMDIQLPGKDGLSLTREIRANPATSHIPVVALTANAMLGDAERCLEAGCVGYITKPINAREFAATVAGFLGKVAAPQ